MRLLLTLLACLMLVVTAWGGTAQAAGFACGEMTEQAAVHAVGDCDEMPADTDKNYPRCQTGCHGHHVAAPVPFRANGTAAAAARTYAAAAEPALTAHQVERTLRPPQA